MLWCVGQLRYESPDGSGLWVWDFQGVFSTELKAVEACKGEDWYVFPVELDYEFPEEAMEAPGAYYPHREPEKMIEGEVERG